jgi:hypothetical protein
MWLIIGMMAMLTPIGLVVLGRFLRVEATGR